MFAVIKTGGKQYPIKSGSVIQVEKLEGDIGQVITMDKVLLANDDSGLIAHDSITVKAEVLEQKREKKVIIFKKKRRKNYQRKNGHRQYCTVLRIIDIERS